MPAGCAGCALDAAKQVDGAAVTKVGGIGQSSITGRLAIRADDRVHRGETGRPGQGPFRNLLALVNPAVLCVALDVPVGKETGVIQAQAESPRSLPWNGHSG